MDINGTSYSIIKEACKLAGLEEIVGTHTLRKTFGYHHYKKYRDVAMLQKIFNHSDPEITLRYIGINQDIIDEIQLTNEFKKYIKRNIDNIIGMVINAIRQKTLDKLFITQKFVEY